MTLWDTWLDVHFIIQHVDECAWFLIYVQVCMYIFVCVLFLVVCTLLGNISVCLKYQKKVPKKFSCVKGYARSSAVPSID